MAPENHHHAHFNRLHAALRREGTRVAGFDVVDRSLDVRRRVGYMPETIPLYPDMTVFEYLKFMADLRRVPNVEDRVDEPPKD